jgi:Bcr/CflA subfamily drug resistance transporter
MNKKYVPFFLIPIFSLGIFATDMYLPCFLKMGQEFQTSITSLEWSVNLNFLGNITGVLLYGPLSDRFGRRPLLMFALQLFLLGSLIIIFSPTIEVLWFGRFIQGFGGATAPIVFAVFRDLYKDKEYVQWLAITGMVISVAPALAPLLGAYIGEHFNWRYNFVLLFCITFTIAGLGLRFYPETIQEKKPLNVRLFFSNYRALLFNRTFFFYSSAAGFTLGGLFAIIVASPYVYLKLYGISEMHFALLTATGVGSYLIGSLCNRQCLERFSSRQLMCFGLIVQVVGGILLLWEAYTPSSHMGFIRGFSLLHTFGMAFVFSNANGLSMKVFPGKEGTSASLFNVIELFWTFILMSLTTLSHNHTSWPLCFYTFLGAALALMSFLMTSQKFFKKT